MMLLEAMSFGIPTVYADVEENRLVAQDCAYAFKPTDAVELADTVIRVLAHPDEAKVLAHKGRRRVIERYDWETVVDRTEEVYAIARARGRGRD